MRRDALPLDVRYEPPGPGPASHNIGLLIGATAATFRNNTMQKSFRTSKQGRIFKCFLGSDQQDLMSSHLNPGKCQKYNHLGEFY